MCENKNLKQAHMGLKGIRVVRVKGGYKWERRGGVIKYLQSTTIQQDTHHKICKH
jgi:hypothetical protein